MRCLVISRDPRFVQSVRAAAPDTLRIADAPDAAAALRAGALAFDAAVVDVLAGADTVIEFLDWWQGAPARRRLPLVLAGAAGVSITDRLPESASRSARDAPAVIASLQPAATGRLDVQAGRLHGPGATVDLTASETALLAYLVRARGRPRAGVIA